MKAIVLAMTALLLSGCQTAGAQPAEAPAYRLVDLSDDFVAFYDRTAGLPSETRVEAFKREIAPLFPEFYGRDRFAQATDEQFNQRIVRAIDGFAPVRERYEAKAARFEALIAPAFASFREAFPDAGPVGDIYLLHSLGEMDGGTRTYNNRTYLIFGADVMGRSHPYDDEEPFFHHELFHTYHDDQFSDCGSVWCALWIEGLATYAAKTLNPDATDAQLLLTVPEPIPAAIDANLNEAICFVRARINSRARNDLRVLFSFDRANERLPPRFGYYVGYLAAREAASEHSLQALAQMNNVQAAPIVDAALARLAACPAN